MDEHYCTTHEAADLLGVCVRTAQQWVDQGLLTAWKTSGGHRRISRVSVSLLLEREARRVKAHAMPVLIIENDASLLQLYRVQMARWQFAISIYNAPNAFEGLVMVGEVRPRLLICVLRLPDLSGFWIVRSLRNMARYSDMSIVVVSSLPPREIDAYGGLPPGVTVMGEPIDFVRLKAVSAKLLSRQMSRPLPAVGK